MSGVQDPREAMKETTFTLEELQILLIAAMVEGRLRPVDMEIMVKAALSMGLTKVECLRAIENLETGRFGSLGPIDERRRVSVYKRLVLVLTENATERSVGAELKLLGRIGLAFGLGQERIKSMVRGALAKHDTTRILLQLQEEEIRKLRELDFIEQAQAESTARKRLKGWQIGAGIALGGIAVVGLFYLWFSTTL